jgi:hypothetical protein
LPSPRLVSSASKSEILDWVDEYEGVVLTPTVWIKVRGSYEGSDCEFLDEMGDLARRFSGDVVEAGFADPSPRAA